MKRIFAFVMVLVMLTPMAMLDFSDRAYAIDDVLFKTTDQEVLTQTGELEVTSPSAVEGKAARAAKAVTEVYWAENDNYVCIIEVGGDMSKLNAPYFNACYTADWEQVRILGGGWDTRKVDINTPGWYPLIWNLAVPSGYYLSPKLKRDKFQVLVYDPEEVSKQEIIGAVVTGGGISMPKGTGDIARREFKYYYSINDVGVSALKKYYTSTKKYTAEYYIHKNNDPEQVHYFSVPIKPNISSVDMEKADSYDIFPKPPPHFYYNNVVRQKTVLHILETDEIDLRGWTLDGFGVLHVNWYHRIKEPELWVSIDNGKWETADVIIERGLINEDVEIEDENFSFYEFKTNYGQNEEYTILRLVEGYLKMGHTYEFEVRYENNGVSINSIILDLTKERGKSYGNGGGSRGGGDRGETKPTEKPEEKPTEKPEEKPTEKPEEKPTEKPTEKPEEKPTEKPDEKPTDKPEEKPTDKPEEKPTEKPDEKPTDPSTKPPIDYSDSGDSGDDWSFPISFYNDKPTYIKETPTVPAPIHIPTKANDRILLKAPANDNPTLNIEDTQPPVVAPTPNETKMQLNEAPVPTETPPPPSEAPISDVAVVAMVGVSGAAGAWGIWKFVLKRLVKRF